MGRGPSTHQFWRFLSIYADYACTLCRRTIKDDVLTRVGEGSVSLSWDLPTYIQTYKIVTGKYDTAVSPKLEKVDSYITRGNDLRLHKRRSRYNLRKYCFTNRIVDVWNCLPNWVVSADITNNFKTRLDKHWHNQDIL